MLKVDVVKGLFIEEMGYSGMTLSTLEDQMKNCILQSSKRERPTLKKTKERWTLISTWIVAFDLDWTGYVCAGLDYQHLQLSSFSSSVWKGQKWLDLIITELELHCSTCYA
ncbi:unnamed protein product [Prunus brigantina]